MRAILLEADWDPRPGFRLSPSEIAEKKATGSAVWRNPSFVSRTIEDPGCGPDEVVVRVRACGVCGSDTHCYETDEQGYIIFSGPVSLPVIPGHEYAGEVVEVGKDVRNLKKGDLVAAEGMLNCGVCEACRTFHPNQCPYLDMVGFSSPGAYAEYITVKERFCWTLNGLAERLGSAQQALEIGALVEPISCPFNGIWVSGNGMRPGDHVAVYGAGPIGLGAILLARAAGAATVTAFDISDERCRIAVECGADQAFNSLTLAKSGDSPAERVLEATGGWGADVHVECAGAAAQTMPEIERSFAPGGQMIYLGRTGERAPVMLDTLVTGASSIVGSRGHVGGGCFPNVIRLLEHGRIDASAMITHRQSFTDVMQALERSCLRTDGKIMMVY